MLSIVNFVIILVDGDECRCIGQALLFWTSNSKNLNPAFSKLHAL